MDVRFLVDLGTEESPDMHEIPFPVEAGGTHQRIGAQHHARLPQAPQPHAQQAPLKDFPGPRFHGVVRVPGKGKRQFQAHEPSREAMYGPFAGKAS